MPESKVVTIIGKEAKDNGFFEFSASDGHTYATKKKEIASKAGKFENRPAKVLYNIVQKGQYTNYYLEDIVEPEEGEVATDSTQTFASPQNASQGRTGASDDARQDQIMRQSTLGYACTLLGGAGAPLDDVYKVAEDFFHYAKTGEKHGGTGLPPTNTDATPSWAQ
jgi:hypothetical protein